LSYQKAGGVQLGDGDRENIFTFWCGVMSWFLQWGATSRFITTALGSSDAVGNVSSRSWWLQTVTCDSDRSLSPSRCSSWQGNL